TTPAGATPREQAPAAPPMPAPTSNRRNLRARARNRHAREQASENGGRNADASDDCGSGIHRRLSRAALTRLLMESFLILVAPRFGLHASDRASTGPLATGSSTGPWPLATSYCLLFTPYRRPRRLPP